MMVDCLPLSLFGSTFRLESEDWTGLVSFSWATEDGGIEVDGNHHLVRKQGWLSGRWDLCQGQEVMAVARKTNPFTRTVEIDWRGEAWRLSASGFGRSMTLSGPRGRMEIRPVHAFTRRSSMEGAEVDPVLASLAFWLTVMLWRRQAGGS